MTFLSAFPVCLNPGMGAAIIGERLNEKNTCLKEHSKFTLKNEIMGMDTNKLTSMRPLYMEIIENMAPKRST